MIGDVCPEAIDRIRLGSAGAQSVNLSKHMYYTLHKTCDFILLFLIDICIYIYIYIYIYPPPSLLDACVVYSSYGYLAKKKTSL